jgi:hypothetical protein
LEKVRRDQEEPSFFLEKDGSVCIACSCGRNPFNQESNQEEPDRDAESVPAFTDKGWLKNGIAEGSLSPPSIMVDIWQVFDYISITAALQLIFLGSFGPQDVERYQQIFTWSKVRCP